MTWASPIDITKGTLNYLVDGVPVIKNVTRQTLVFDNFSGTYVGAMHFTSANCLPPNPNGTVEVFGTLLVSQNGQNMTVTFLPQSGGRSVPSVRSRKTASSVRLTALTPPLQGRQALRSSLK